jgi:hypothetical protein
VKWAAIGLVSTVFVVVVLILILLFHTAAPPVVRVDRVAAERLEAEMRLAQSEAASQTSRVVHVEEGAANAMLESYLAPARARGNSDDRATVEDMKVKLQNDMIEVYILLSVKGKEVSLDVKGRLYTENGYAQFQPIEGHIGALPIPQAALVDAMRQKMASPDTRAMMRLPDYLSDVRVEDGKIVATFR